MPPCRSYRNLIVLDEFDLFFAKYDDCLTSKQLQEAKKCAKPFKAAYNDLISQWIAAADSLKRGYRAAVKAAAVARGTGSDKKKKTGGLWEKVVVFKLVCLGRAQVEQMNWAT